MSVEKKRAQPEWRIWGPYLAERQWGTVREDYSGDGNAWSYFTHDMSRSRTYRWGEDGIAGISDEKCRLCFGLGLWNGKDPIIKERLFGLTGPEGNHGEDVKEYYYYLDATPSHSYLKMLYKYPQAEFPYQRLVDESRRRTRQDPEFELVETGIFEENRYWDVFIEYAKESPKDILIKITAINRGPDAATLHLVPQVWFRNRWSWHVGNNKPALRQVESDAIQITEEDIGSYHLSIDRTPEILFCDNETNVKRLYGIQNQQGFWKDGINDFIVNGDKTAVNPLRVGTKAGMRTVHAVPPGGSAVIRLRLTAGTTPQKDPFTDFEKIVAARISEADEFYDELHDGLDNPDAADIQRQAFAGMIWSKQYYRYDLRTWLTGDAGYPPPPVDRTKRRNAQWLHLRAAEIISMPDKWEYPWFAAWDLAFHCIPFAMIDPDFAKQQLLLLTREWYMHPNGQLPAYEWSFGDANPPVHAWAAWRVYKIDKKMQGQGDLDFLERIFLKLCLNFTWWVNQKDEAGHNIFQGGFLGLDNIGVFDRNVNLPNGGHIEQADATAWMAMYSLNLMRMACELATIRPAYQDMATKFFEHFLLIAEAMMHMGKEGIRLWDPEDEFYYDVLHLPNQNPVPLKIRSLVGLIPLFAVETLEPEMLNQMPEFKERLEWFLSNRPELSNLVSRWQTPGKGERRLLSLLRGHRMKKLLKRLLDENEFLSPYGIRALSKYHLQHPYEFRMGSELLTVKYTPGESDSDMFGGNSNWRGPIWFPTNFLLIESLQKFHHYYGDEFKVECPTGSGVFMTLNEIANELTQRLCKIFMKDKDGFRAVFGSSDKLQHDPHFKDYIPFFEYFHGDSGKGIGASHQTGWTGLIAKLLQPRGKREAVAG